MAMMEAQNKLLRSLALRIDPSFELPEGTEEVSWRACGADGLDGADGKNRTAVDGGQEDAVPTDQTSVDLTSEEKS